MLHQTKYWHLHNSLIPKNLTWNIVWHAVYLITYKKHILLAFSMISLANILCFCKINISEIYKTAKTHFKNVLIRMYLSTFFKYIYHLFSDIFSSSDHINYKKIVELWTVEHVKGNGLELLQNTGQPVNKNNKPSIMAAPWAYIWINDLQN